MNLLHLPLYAKARRLRRRLTQLGYFVSGPQVLNVFTTNRCTFSCYYCSRNVKNGTFALESRYQDNSEFQARDLELLLDKYPGIKRVSFVGIGEPFLNKALVPMAKLSKERGKWVGVITNGSLLHYHWGELATSFNELSISLHGLSAAELKVTSGVEESMFYQVIENIRQLVLSERTLNHSLGIRASVIFLKNNVERLEKAASFCEAHTIPELDIHNYIPYSLDDSNLCLFDDEQDYIAYIKRLRDRFRRVQITAPILIKRNSSKLFWGCTSFFSTLRADGLGQVSGCCRVMVPLSVNGNFRSEPDVWRNNYFNDMRKRFRTREGLPEFCRYCPEAQ